MTKIYKDVTTGKMYSTEEIGMKFYRFIDHRVFPTVNEFIESASVENGGSLKEMTDDELYLSDEEFSVYRDWTNLGYFESLKKKCPIDISYRKFTDEQRTLMHEDGLRVIEKFVKSHKNERLF